MAGECRKGGGRRIIVLNVTVFCCFFLNIIWKGWEID